MVRVGRRLETPLRAVLLDVGGTLWPDGFPPVPDREAFVTSRLREVLPEISASVASHLVMEMERALSAYGVGPGIHGPENTGLELTPAGGGFDAISPSASVPRAGARLEQDSDGRVREAAARCGVALSTAEATAARRALCIPVVGRVELFAGAVDLLRTIKEQGARSVVVSNTITRDSALYWKDFEGYDVSQFIDVVLTSIDVGFRKPHPAIFAAALDAAQCAPEACLMVGNSEQNDIIPAKGLGMRAVRVCIEEPPPKSSEADAVVTSLQQVTDLFRAWSV